MSADIIIFPLTLGIVFFIAFVFYNFGKFSEFMSNTKDKLKELKKES